MGLVLLLLVTFNVTAEFVHHHGRALAASATTATAIGDTSTGETTAKTSSSDICLLCQFQQQLALGLLHTPPFTLRPVTRTANVAVAANHYLPITRALPCGRAPPLASVF
jgi:hypothetical protein